MPSFQILAPNRNEKGLSIVGKMFSGTPEYHKPTVLSNLKRKLREDSGCKIEFATEPKFSRIEFEGKDFSSGKREVTIGPNHI